MTAGRFCTIASSTCRMRQRIGWGSRKMAAAKSTSKRSCPARSPNRRRPRGRPCGRAPPLAPPSELKPANASADAAPVSSAGAGYSVQLGAFANFANAQAFLAHVQNQLANAQVEPKIRQAGGLYRVYIGPYTARGEAERTGERITQAFGFPTTVAPH